MKLFVVFIILFEVCYSYDKEEKIDLKDVKHEEGSDWGELTGYPYKHGYRLKIKDDYNFYRVGLEKDEIEDIYRPCDFEDWKCIRKFFAKNSECEPTHGPIPDPLYLRVNTLYYDFVNLTVTLNNLKLFGMSRFNVSEFYLNKNTGNVVLAFNFTNLNLTIPRASFRYKRTGKESIVLNDYATNSVSGTFTAVIPRVPHLSLEHADMHADINDAFPPFVIGPNAANSTDPDVLTAFANFGADVPTAVQESYLLQAYLFTAIYIQKNICDFGVKLYSI